MKKAKLSIIAAVAFLFLVNLSSMVYAASNDLKLPDYTDPQKVDTPSVFSLLVRLVISLIVIAILAYLVIKFLRKNMQARNDGDSISILDQVALGLNKGIFITEIGNKVYVLGVTDHNINLVTEINDPNVIADMRNKAAERQMEPVVPTSVTSFILNLINNIRNNSAKTNRQKDFKSHIQAQVNKLQSMFEKGREEDKDEE